MKSLVGIAAMVLLAALGVGACARRNPEAPDVNRGYLDVMAAGAVREANALAAEAKGKLVVVVADWPGFGERNAELLSHVERYAKKAGFPEVTVFRVPYDETAIGGISGQFFERVLREHRDASVVLWMTGLPPQAQAAVRPSPAPRVVVLAEVGAERKPEHLLRQKKADVLITSKGYTFQEQKGRDPLELFNEYFEVTRL